MRPRNWLHCYPCRGCEPESPVGFGRRKSVDEQRTTALIGRLTCKLRRGHQNTKGLSRYLPDRVITASRGACCQPRAGITGIKADSKYHGDMCQYHGDMCQYLGICVNTWGYVSIPWDTRQRQRGVAASGDMIASRGYHDTMGNNTKGVS